MLFMDPFSRIPHTCRSTSRNICFKNWIRGFPSRWSVFFCVPLLDEMSERKQQKSECLLWDVFKIVQSVVSEPNVGNAALVHAFGCETRDVVFWNAMMSACVENRSFQAAVGFFKKMVGEGMYEFARVWCWLGNPWTGNQIGLWENNHISVANSLISFYSQFRDIHATETVFKGMVVKNVVSWNAMIKGFFLNEQAEEAFYLLRAMQFVASIQPDIATVVTIIPFCAELLLREGKAAHGFTIRRRWHQNYQSSTVSLI
ncbi:UNVERIFIED_CONTAM: Pentatricopeptide repeat-containing protein, partial [Sesamum calycinum]